MHWKRLAHAFLLGTGFCVFGAGCSTINALVSSEAGSGAGRNSPERIAAIGRVFENQGRYAQAQAMYRRTLKSQPGNQFARERLQYLASRTAGQGANDVQQRTSTAVAVADSVRTRRPSSQSQPARPKDAAVRRRPEPDTESIPQLNSATVADLASDIVDKATTLDQAVQSADAVVDAVEGSQLLVETTSEGSDSDVAVPLLSAVADFPAKKEADDSASDEGIEIVARTGDRPKQSRNIELVDLTVESGDSKAAELESAVTEDLDDRDVVTPVAFSAIESGSDSSGWKTTERQVTLNEVILWLETPSEFEKELLTALRHGKDAGVKSLAASALADCNGESVNDELRAASQNGADLVKVTALESLTSRGQLQRDDVTTLLSLISGDDTDVRTQAAGCLRYLATSEWCAECVEGLTGLLKDKDPAVVAMAATTLGDFGEAAVTHRPTLARLQSEAADKFVREAAGHALNRIPDGEQPPQEPDESATDDLNDVGAILPVVQ